MHMGCVLLNYVLEHVKADSSYRELTMKDPDSVHTHWFKLSVCGGGASCFCPAFATVSGWVPFGLETQDKKIRET